MDREIERSIAKYLDSVHTASRELVELPAEHLDRIEVRRILIKLMQQSTALLTELEEDELKEEENLQSEREAEKQRREAALREEARRRLEKPPRVARVGVPYHPILAVIGLLLFHVVFFVLVGIVVYATNEIWYHFTPR